MHIIYNIRTSKPSNHPQSTHHGIYEYHLRPQSTNPPFPSKDPARTVKFNPFKTNGRPGLGGRFKRGAQSIIEIPLSLKGSVLEEI